MSTLSKRGRSLSTSQSSSQTTFNAVVVRFTSDTIQLNRQRSPLDRGRITYMASTSARELIRNAIKTAFKSPSRLGGTWTAFRLFDILYIRWGSKLKSILRSHKSFHGGKTDDFVRAYQWRSRYRPVRMHDLRASVCTNVMQSI